MSQGKYELVPAEESFIGMMKDLLAEDKIELVLQKLRAYSKGVSTSFEDDIAQQAGMMASANNLLKRGVINMSYYGQRRATIQFNLTQYLNSIPKERHLAGLLKTFNSGNAPINSIKTLSSGDFEKIIGRNELFEINWLEKAMNASKSICKIELSNGASGTGFLLKGGYVMTNNHVFPNHEKVQNSKAIFNYRLSSDGQATQAVQEFRFKTDFLIGSSKTELDYSLVKIDMTETALNDFGYLELETNKILEVGEKVNIIQHPGGGHMKIALPDDIISLWNQHLFYLVDTEPGSSGSPIFNQDWKVVGLHHAGKIENGGFRINEQGERRKSNRGILIKEVLAHMEGENKDLSHMISNHTA